MDAGRLPAPARIPGAAPGQGREELRARARRRRRRRRVMAAPKHQVVIGGRDLTFSNLDKVLWPRDGYTKGDLIAYYRSVSAWLLPHLKDRPLTLQRWPDGIDKQSFFEKQAPSTRRSGYRPSRCR